MPAGKTLKMADQIQKTLPFVRTGSSFIYFGGLGNHNHYAAKLLRSQINRYIRQGIGMQPAQQYWRKQQTHSGVALEP
jgi:hypothetical protein